MRRLLAVLLLTAAAVSCPQAQAAPRPPVPFNMHTDVGGKR